VTGKPQGSPKSAEILGEAYSEPSRRFTELYEQYFGFVWRSVRMMGLASDAADDAAQDVFLVAHRRLVDFEARSAPRTWLFAITLRVVSDHRRSRRRRMRLLERAGSMDRVPIETPEGTTASAEQRAALLALLAELPEEQRAVFVLAELEELAAPEIAAALDVNLNTVYSRLRAARKMMASRLRTLDSEQPL
jgi:RNA polymerase sigma-70 factor, ECF subfamily